MRIERKALLAAAPLLLFALLAACTPSQGGVPSSTGTAAQSGFDDHTRDHLASLEDFHELAFTDGASVELKFVVLNFHDAERRQVRFLDGDFYTFHDEWYWFHLINGQMAPGDTQVPYVGRTFSDPQKATQWARVQSALPGGLEFVEERLYARRFYSLALEKSPKIYGLGRVFSLSQSGGERRWYFELEYQDKVTAELLSIYFAALSGALPPAIQKSLKWVARSPQQHALLATLRRDKSKLASRVAASRDLAEAGQIEVYNAGLGAGRLRLVAPEEMQGLSDTKDDILVLPQIPDYLPQARGLITEVPQTPLSHVNLLAKNRGIPNSYVAGAGSSRHLSQLIRAEMPVVYWAEGDQIQVEALDDDVFHLWQRLVRPQEKRAPFVDVSLLPRIRMLRGEDFSRVGQERSVIGGKAAGFLALKSARVTLPPEHLAITVRAYEEHMRPLQFLIRGLLADESFRRFERIRFLLLEGESKYRKHYPAKADRSFAKAFLKERRAGRDSVARVLREGGLTKMIRRARIEPSTLSEIREALAHVFGNYAPTQGLRFRSSSTVEDIEGFNGAGLYASSTGFLHAEAQHREKDRRRTVEFAIKRTWASYWGWEAFEERERELVEHQSGRMAVLVHARFDDALELANGVISFSLDEREKRAEAALRHMSVNLQKGAESVTNPQPGQLPEVIEVSRRGRAPVRIVRAKSKGKGKRASLGQRDQPASVLSDTQLSQLFSEASRVADHWLSQENQGRAQPQKRRLLNLDFEFRLMAPAWPQKRSRKSSTAPQLLLKQVRSLEPAAPSLDKKWHSLPIPREVLHRALRLDHVTCVRPGFEFEALRVWTNALSQPDLGYSEQPFLAELRVKSAELGRAQVVDWMGISGSWKGASLHKEGRAIGRYSLSFGGNDGHEWSLRGDAKELKLRRDDGLSTEHSVECKVKALLDDPARLLREALSSTPVSPVQ